jgi:hypothetical protein
MHLGLKKGKALFFIVGRPRSGTSLLSYMLNMHKDVLVPPEAALILNLKRRFSHIKKWDKKQRRKFLEFLFRFRKLRYWNLDHRFLRKRIIKMDDQVEWDDLIGEVYRCFGQKYAKENYRLIGDKNPVYSLYIKFIHKLFPEARYLFIQRDYHDQIASVRKFSFETHNISILAWRWKYVANVMQYMLRKYPDQCMCIRYEDLVRNPQAVLSDVCAFLAISYSEIMLDYKNDPFLKERIPDTGFMTFHSGLQEKPNTDKIGNGVRHLQREHIEQMEYVVGKTEGACVYPSIFQRKGKLLFFFRSLPGVIYAALYQHISCFLLRSTLFRGYVVGDERAGLAYIYHRFRKKRSG